MVAPDPVDVLVDCLEIHRILLLRNQWLLLRRLAVLLSTVALAEVEHAIGFLRTLAGRKDALLRDDLVNQVRKNPVAIVMEELLEKLVLVIVIVKFDDEGVNLLNLVKHVQVLLGFYCVEDSLRVFAQLRQLLRNNAMLSLAGARLRSTHDEVDDLGLSQLDSWRSKAHLLIHLLLSLPVSDCATRLGLRIVTWYLQ